jgi:hypothetical protein
MEYPFWQVFSEDIRRQVAEKFGGIGGFIKDEFTGATFCPIGYAKYLHRPFEAENPFYGYLCRPCSLGITPIIQGIGGPELGRKVNSWDIERFMTENDHGQIKNMWEALGVAPPDPEANAAVAEAENIIREAAYEHVYA